MKKIHNRLSFALLIFLSVSLGYFTFTLSDEVEIKENEKLELEVKLVVVKHQLDSVEVKYQKRVEAFLDHYEKCSFIDNESIEVGYGNYLRKKDVLDKRGEDEVGN